MAEEEEILMGRQWAIGLVAIAIAAAACGPHDEPAERLRPATGASAAARTAAPPPGTEGARASSRRNAPRIVFLGDSLTAGLGLPVEQSYPSLIHQRLNKEAMSFEPVNAGVSVDTSAGGLSRL